MLALLLLLVRLITPNFFITVFSPVFESADALAAESHLFFSSFGDRATLAFQNEQFQNENATLSLQNQALLQKTSRLEALLDASTATRPSTTQLLAEVLARPPESPYDTFLLNIGSRAGVVLGMGAFVSTTDESDSGIVPIGIVSTVATDFSRVTLYSSPGVRTAAWVGSAHTPLTLVGLGAGAVSASVARAAGVSVGDAVFSVGPGTSPLGRVVRIDSDPSSPAVVLRILPAVNPFSISEVLLRDVGASFRGTFILASSTTL